MICRQCVYIKLSSNSHCFYVRDGVGLGLADLAGWVVDGVGPPNQRHDRTSKPVPVLPPDE